MRSNSRLVTLGCGFRAEIVKKIDEFAIWRTVYSGELIAVFANPNNAKRFVKTLNSYGLSASYFINPENNWRYVYLKRHASWNNALISYYSKINDSYDDKMWIMRVSPDLVA